MHSFLEFVQISRSDSVLPECHLGVAVVEMMEEVQELQLEMAVTGSKLQLGKGMKTGH